MKIHPPIFSVIVLTACGCQNKEDENSAPRIKDPGELQSDVNKKFDSNIDHHAILSVWYLHQYRAVNILNRIEGVKLETGSKISESPASMLDKQHELIVNLKPEQLDSSEVSQWIELQDGVAKDLCSKLGVQIELVSNVALPSEKVEKLVELQKKALQILE